MKTWRRGEKETGKQCLRRSLSHWRAHHTSTEHLSSETQCPCKKPGMIACAYNTSTRETGASRSLRIAYQSLASSVPVRDPVWTSQVKGTWGMIPKINLWHRHMTVQLYILTHIHMHTYKHTYILTHSHIYTQTYIFIRTHTYATWSHLVPFLAESTHP